ncbi:MAG: DNA internalization-related competence protein ComEC/Rec2 [Thiotrichaceae bacterium]|nr:DNA internalization-related competence protein ComEC/Rec2 [Thiotrichaceae bacterium]PCI14306.1 MAG: DNA internalization-related competence protein ComEC/Rec2 [Thiotrichales bacterium]
MRIAAVAFLAGILLFQQLAELPLTSLAYTVGWLVLLLLVPALWLFKRLRSLLFLLIGFHWAWLQATLVLLTPLPPALEKQDLVIVGTIASLPQKTGHKWRFLFDIEQMQHQGNIIEISPRHVRLNWYNNAPELSVGDRWQLMVRLKRPHGFMNPGGFDYEGWLFQQRIQATGYIRGSEDNRLLASDMMHYPLQRLRQSLASAISTQLKEAEFKGIITALAIGERQAISEPQWGVLRKTGTIHLVAISGLHIGLVAGMAFILVQFLWSRFASATMHWPAPRVAAVAGLLAATCYAALAGFTIPTQRALVMVLVVMLMLFLQRQRRFSDALALALMIVLVIDPFVVMSAGFWLSFGAVAAIIFAMSCRLARRDLWWRWGRVHVVVTIALLLPLLMTFQQLPLLSPVANFIAVPWVSFVVVPLVLLGTSCVLYFPEMASLLLDAASTALSFLWPFLEFLENQEQGLWQQHPPPKWTYIPALIGTLLLLAPRGLPGRWLGVIWLLPLFLVTPLRPADGDWWFTLLDVGQGLAAVVQTKNHTLVYDTGPRFSERFDTGSAVVIPFLNHAGVKRVDMLVIGHGDNDHMGGAQSVMSQIVVSQVITSVPERVTWQPAAQHCVAGDEWQWDNVRFEILHPPPQGFKGNDASCVLRVSSVDDIGLRGSSLLLTGDIEAAAERALLNDQPGKLMARVVVAPHHGSKSSSSDLFVAAVAPQYVLFPAGYLNRYHFPHSEVTQRYQQQGSKMFISAATGAMTFHFNHAGEVRSFARYRYQNKRYWHSDLLR